MASFTRLEDCCGVTELIGVNRSSINDIRRVLKDVEEDILQSNEIDEPGKHMCIATITDKQTSKTLKECGFKRRRLFKNASSGNILEVWSKIITIKPLPEEGYW